ARSIVDGDGMTLKVGEPLQRSFPPLICGPNGKHYWKDNGHTHQHIGKPGDESEVITDVGGYYGQDSDYNRLVVNNEQKTLQDPFHRRGLSMQKSEKT